MASSTSSQNIKLELTPWTDSGFSIDWVSFKEELGGTLPTGNVSLVFPRDQESLDSLLNINNGTFILEDNNPEGFCFEVPITVLNRSYDKNTLLLEFVGVANANFITTRVTADYKDISDAMGTLYPGELDVRVDSDLSNNQMLHQSCETGLDYLNRLLYSYKENTVFGYTWTGLLFKDLIGRSSVGTDESVDNRLPSIVGGGTGNLTNIEPYTMTYSKVGNYKIVDPWEDSDNPLKVAYKDDKPINVTSILSSGYHICRTGYEDMLVNHIKNAINFSTGFTGNYTITGTLMPNNYRIGDIVFYRRAEDDDVIDSSYYTKCLVYSNSVFMGNGQSMVSPRGFNFEWTTELRLVESGPWCKVSDSEEDEIS